MGIGDWGLGIGDWAQSPIPNPQSPIPNPQSSVFLKRSNILMKNFQKLNNIFHLIIRPMNFNYSTMEPTKENKPKGQIKINAEQDEHKGGKGAVKVVKGARDFMPYQMSIRNKAFKNNHIRF